MGEPRWGRADDTPWDDPDRLGLEAFRNTPDMVIVVDDAWRVGATSPGARFVVRLPGEHVDAPER